MLGRLAEHRGAQEQPEEVPTSMRRDLDGGGGVECTFKHGDQNKRKREKVTGDSERQVRRIVDGLPPKPKNSNRTGTRPSKTDDRPACFKHKREQCAKDTNRDHWHLSFCILHEKTKQSRHHLSVRSSQ